jgi:SSS family solute:Na+ symporter
MTAAGAASGLLAGVAVVCGLVFSGRDPFHGVNAGLIGLAVNLAVNLAVSSATQPAASPDRLAVDELGFLPGELSGAGQAGGERGR